jgi:hypothetical protein
MNRFINYILIVLISGMITYSCSTEPDQSSPIPASDVALNPHKDAEIQRHNIELRKDRSERFPCDTISVIEHVFNNYPHGSYLLQTDKTTLNSLPKTAVKYFDDKDGSNYVFAVIATSRSGERLVEVKNLVGYDESYIDLDSTNLGTPFIYLILLECIGNNLNLVWESIIPSHGGFKTFSIKNWDYNGTLFVETVFYYAQGIGTISYNYFLIDGISTTPHLLMTYDGLDFRRTITNVNNDEYPDYHEYVFVSLPDRVFARDSVAFVWDKKTGVYINSRNARQTRPY